MALWSADGGVTGRPGIIVRADAVIATADGFYPDAPFPGYVRDGGGRRRRRHARDARDIGAIIELLTRAGLL